MTFRLRSVMAFATCAFVALGCSGEYSPTMTGPLASSSKDQESRPGKRLKDHTLRLGEVDLYLDDMAETLHDGLGRETRIPTVTFVLMRKAFDEIAANDVFLARLDSDKEYNTCLKEAQKRKVKVRATRYGVSGMVDSPWRPATSEVELLPASRSLTQSLFPTGPLVNASSSYEPTYCQAAAMYLYDASSVYRSARANYIFALGGSFASGLTILEGVIIYDPFQPLQFAAAAAVEYAFYAMTRARTEAGIAGTFWHLGGCGQPGAQYGYFDPTSGGGTTGLNCVQEQVTIEAADEGGNWYVFWSGTATVCS